VPDRRRRAAVIGRDADRNSHSYSILVATQQQHRRIIFSSVDLQGRSVEHLSSCKEFDSHRGFIG